MLPPMLTKQLIEMVSKLTLEVVEDLLLGAWGMGLAKGINGRRRDEKWVIVAEKN